jgi:hypothetical protein
MSGRPALAAREPTQTEYQTSNYTKFWRNPCRIWKSRARYSAFSAAMSCSSAAFASPKSMAHFGSA